MKLIFFQVPVLLCVFVSLLESAYTNTAAKGTFFNLYAKAHEKQRTIHVHAGEKFHIKLKANHTTGYEWRAVRGPARAILEFAGKTYEAPDSKRIGAGGHEIWTFRALQTGKTILFLEYVRPWEKNEPARSVQYVIVVD